MGLDFTLRREDAVLGEDGSYPLEAYLDLPERVQFSYGGFMQYRRLLCQLAYDGIDLSDMQGFGGEGDWMEYNHDPISLLLNHSDCDGDLRVWHCVALAPRLRELAEQITAEAIAKTQDDDDDPLYGPDDVDYLRQRTVGLAMACEAAVANNARLVFC